jgi:NAD(P)-dependent dehydrogenase (short-subunit alcohol dehydrogenase family)
MSEVQDAPRSAVVFGARNLGRAVIETLVANGWAVAGVAQSRSTLDGVRDAGALALKADVTDPASVYAALEEVAAAHGGVDLALNAASAYGGDRGGPFGGGGGSDDRAPCRSRRGAMITPPARSSWVRGDAELLIGCRCRQVMSTAQSPSRPVRWPRSRRTSSASVSTGAGGRSA